MRKFFATCALLASGALSLAFVCLASPILAAMRTDRENRARLEALGRERWQPEYDDNDPGHDVDREPQTTDYCVVCGESPESGSHLPHGHDYVAPWTVH